MIKKKIILISTYWSPVIGGITTHSKNLYLEMKEHNDLDVKIIFKEGESKNKDEIALTYKNKIAFSIHCLKELIKNKPEVITNHGPWFLSLPCVIYKLLNPQVKIFQTHHTDSNKYLRGIKKKIYETLLSKFDENIFVSKYLQKKFEYYNISGKKRVIYGGVNISNKYKESDLLRYKKEFNINDRGFNVTYIANFAWQKKTEGAKLLVKSIYSVLRTHSEVKLLIVGNGPYRKDVEKIVNELGLEQKVIFVGEVINSNIVLRATDILAHITFQESLGLVVLEAMAHKKPVVASKIGGIPELIENKKTGLLVNNTEKDIANAIISLIENPKLIKTLANDSFRHVSKNFTWKKTAKEYIDMFQEYETSN